ncbi:NUDIX hydrolase [Defluviicoccus vanus]|uniref:NUDIX hydrolase n=2 Tax=Defluviicoccus vanus TaxID=111831 RepID=A0A7H1MZ16_9PROT|nr:NUDIX hydrolase [Defluviicoccus vanus]
MKMKTKSWIQFAALPFRMREGQPEVLLITSRETGRWIIPKGWPAKSLTPSAVAAREAYEEAGLVGKVRKRSVGTFRYEKRLPRESVVSCKVRVFLLDVKEELDRWPEQDHRERCWLSPAEAAERVGEAELSRLLRSLPGLLN